MEGVTFLPPELARAKEQAGPHLPSHDAVPLVRELRQVSMAVDVAPDDLADDRFGRGPHSERLRELFHSGARLGHPGDLGPKTLDVLRLFDEELLGDEERERPVLVPALFD